MNEQPKWLARAKETYKFHRSRLISTDDWTLEKTAKALRRSIGPISEDLLIARWCKTHEKQIENFTYAYEAIEFIKGKKREQDLTEIE
jgi:hypothetical protein